jgi:phenylacetic acid degradation operon negative regulatory protein
MTDRSQAWDAIIERLQGPGRLRVWSVIITVFGDAIAPHGGSIPLQTLQEIMSRLGIEAGAVRTALSRLASEGWVTREREGRLSHYSLAPQGQRAFDEATQRIYAARASEWDGRWTVAVPTNGNGEAGPGFKAAGFASHGGTWVRPDVRNAPELPVNLDGFLVVSGTAVSVPADVLALWNVDDIVRQVRDFARYIAPLAEALEGGASPQPLDALAARTLLIHEWRRMVLRTPPLPDALLPPEWLGREVRAQLKSIYSRLAGPSEAWLTSAGLPPLVDPDAFAARFGAS